MDLVWIFIKFGIAVLILIVVCAYSYLIRKFDYWKKKGVKVVRPFPFMGNLKDVILLKKNMGMLARDIYIEHKKEPYIGIFAFNTPILLIHDLELAKAVLVKDSEVFVDRLVSSEEEIDPILQRDIFGLRGECWRQVRHAVSPAFSSESVKRMYELVTESGRSLVASIETEKYTGKPVDVYDIASRYSTDVFASCVFGTHRNEIFPTPMLRDIFKRHFQLSIVQVILGATLFSAPRFFKRLASKMLSAELEFYVRAAVTTTAKQKQMHHTKRNDFIDCLLQLKNSKYIAECDEEQSTRPTNQIIFDYEEMSGHAFSILTAGFETSINTISFMLFELAQNQEIQNKLRKEILAGLGNDVTVSYEILHGMKYLDMVMRETLRKYPSLPFIERKSNKPYILPGTNVTLMKDASIIIPVWGFHSDPEFYPDPKKFNPERFSDSRMTNVVNSYIPFGDGPRRCIGIQFAQTLVKSAIANLLPRFSVHPCSTTPGEIQFDPKYLLLKPKQVIELMLSPLSQ